MALNKEKRKLHYEKLLKESLERHSKIVDNKLNILKVINWEKLNTYNEKIKLQKNN